MTIACQILIYLIAVCGLNFITGLTWACGAAVGVGIQIVVAFIA
jgi:hypothetical protein